MRASAALAAALLAALASAGRPKPEPYEAVHQAEYLLASILDHKQYDRLREAMTDDVVYDSRPLGPWAPRTAACRSGWSRRRPTSAPAFGDALVEHQVGNALVASTNDQATAANVSTYLTWSRWDKAAPGDVAKTFRIFERCDDVFVVDPKDGRWKLEYSLVTNMGPDVEAIYFKPGGGKGDDGRWGKGGRKDYD